MNAKFHQRALKAAFERAPIIDDAPSQAPQPSASPELTGTTETPEPSGILGPSARAPALADPRPARDLADILLAHGRLALADADRARALAAQTKRPLAAAIARLRLARPGDIQAGLAIAEGLVRDDAGAFRLDRSLVVIRRPRSTEAERFRLLRTRLLTTQKPDRLKGIAVAAAGPGVSGEFVAANLAAAFARLKQRTLIIDADLRRPSLARILAAPGETGLSDHLAGAADWQGAVRKTVIEGLELLPAGEPTLDPQALLAGPAFAETLAAARRNYDVVLILTSPSGQIADGQFVWALAGAALVVARRNVTRADDLRQMNATLRQIGAETLGAVLTG